MGRWCSGRIAGCEPAGVGSTPTRPSTPESGDYYTPGHTPRNGGSLKT